MQARRRNFNCKRGGIREKPGGARYAKVKRQLDILAYMSDAPCRFNS